MSAMSNYLEDALINAVLRNTSYTSPATVYLSLHTADPTDAGTGAEISGDGYSRQACAFSAPSGGATSNSAEETFTASGGDWGTITHFGIWDASTNGNLLFHGALTASRDVNDGETLTIAIGDLDVTLE